MEEDPNFEWIRFANKEKTEYKTNKVFLHISRTGGKAVKKFLWHTDSAHYLRRIHLDTEVEKKYTNWGETLSKVPGINYAPGSLFIHHPISNFDQNFLKDKQVFAIIRNPWEKFASHYYFAKYFATQHYWMESSMLACFGVYLKYAGGIFPERKEGIPHPSIPSDYIGTYSFDEYIAMKDSPYYKEPSLFGWYDHCNPMMGFHSQKSFIENHDVDCIRFETRSEDLKKYLGDWKEEEEHTDLMLCPAGRSSNAHLKPNFGKRPDYKSMYTEKQIQIVADIYKEDIEHWGFDFDTGAKRNYWGS